MSLQVASPNKSAKRLWREIGACLNVKNQQQIKRISSKSKFCSSHPKSPQSVTTKQFKLHTQFSHSFIKEMNRQQGSFDLSISEAGQMNKADQVLHQSNEQKYQPGKQKGQSSNKVSSRETNVAPESRTFKKNETIQSYQFLIANLQRQFLNFQNQMINQLKDIQNYYSKMISQLQVRYMEEIQRLQIQISLSKKIMPDLDKNSSLIYRYNSEKIQKIKLPILKSQISSKNRYYEQIQNNPSLSNLATGIKKQQFKKFAETFQKIKTEMNQEISMNSLQKYASSGQIRMKIAI